MTLDIRGYAIVSEDDKIAAADGLTPSSLRNEKDWAYYQAALARADIVVFGRRSHEAEPNVHGQRRVVVSRSAAGLEQRADAWWWDPERAPWQEVAARLLPEGGLVAAPGGHVVFDLFLAIGFTEFHMSRARGVTLPGGRSVFSLCEAGVPAETVLAEGGLALSETIPLDPAHGVEMKIWRRAGG
ncbi:MAG: hypothetical protein JO107_06570 [Hyphomicrobiales bacterium]|nr:hypothetical protein [Hyphomicrobiales bacterium]